jgi:hypothetical protein
MLGRPRYSPSEVEGFQPELYSPAETEEGCEGEETPEVSLATEEALSTPVAVLRGSTPPPKGHNEGTKTIMRTDSAMPEPTQARQLFEEGTTGGCRLIPEPIVREMCGVEKPQRSEAPPNVKAETTPEASSGHSESEAISAGEDIPYTEGPSTSRPRSPLKSLGQGFEDARWRPFKI